MLALEGIREQSHFRPMSGAEQQASWQVSNEVVNRQAAKGGRQFVWEPCGASIAGGWEDGSDFQCKNTWPSSLNVSITMDRELPWDEAKQEWRWHKTWRLPEIVVDVSGAEALHRKQVRLSTVCNNPKSGLMEVKMVCPDGQQSPFTTHLVDGQGRFLRLRFKATSNTYGGRKFHLVVSVVDVDRPDEPVLASLISSAFCVYSRRDADKSRRGTLSESFHTWGSFSPDLLTMDLIKKTPGHGSTAQEKIDNSLPGVIRYFKAPNIRHKSKRPLLLLLRFNNVLLLTRNSKVFPTANEDTLKNLFCTCGFSVKCHQPACKRCNKGAPESDSRQPLWFVTLRNPQQIPGSHLKWLMEHLKFLKSPQLGLVTSASMLPQEYVPTENVDQMIELYTRLYMLEHAAKSADETQDRSDASPVREENARSPMFSFDGADSGLGEGLSERTLELSQMVTGESQTWSSTLPGPSSRDGRRQFQEYNRFKHREVMVLFERLVEQASMAVTTSTPQARQTLRTTLFNCAEKIAALFQSEDTVLFRELNRRQPGICEAYFVDHQRQSEHLSELNEQMSQGGHDPVEVFLKVVGYAAQLREHIEKEEEHLMSHFWRNFSAEELALLWRAAEAESRRVQGLAQQEASMRSDSGNSAYQVPRAYSGS